MTAAYNRSIVIVAGTSLLAFQHRVLNAAGTLATGVPQAHGILDAKVDSGNDATLVYDGRHRYQAGGAISGQDWLTVDSGGFITAAASGDGIVGQNEHQAVTSGSFGDGVFSFLNRGSMTTSEG